MKQSLRFYLLRMSLVLFISLIILGSYSIYISANNIIQTLVAHHNFGASEFTQRTIDSTRITLFILGLCFFKLFQSLSYQRMLLTLLMIILLTLPLGVNLYYNFYDVQEIVSGLSKAIFILGEAWRQIYVPPLYRATITGISAALTGIIDIRSTMVQSDWSVINLYRYQNITIALVILLPGFWWLTNRLKQSAVNFSLVKNSSDNIVKLIARYPYIFIICFLGGFNGAIFLYGWFLGDEILPNHPHQYYQDILYLAAIVWPILFGIIADRYGIFLITLLTLASITLFKFLSAWLAYGGITVAWVYYALGFIEAGLVASLWMLSSALIGECLRNKGIFVSMALSNIIFAVGTLVVGRIYKHFLLSFVITKLTLGTIDLVLVCLLIYYYVKEQRAAKLIL